jgi:hypothetical protein
VTNYLRIIRAGIKHTGILPVCPNAHVFPTAAWWL